MSNGETLPNILGFIMVLIIHCVIQLYIINGLGFPQSSPSSSPAPKQLAVKPGALQRTRQCRPDIGIGGKNQGISTVKTGRRPGFSWMEPALKVKFAPKPWNQNRKTWRFIKQVWGFHK